MSDPTYPAWDRDNMTILPGFMPQEEEQRAAGPEISFEESDSVDISAPAKPLDGYQQTPLLPLDRRTEFVDAIMSSKEPQREISRVNSAMFFAQRFDEDPAHVYRNLDMFAQQYFDEQIPAERLWGAVKNEWQRGIQQVELGKIGAQFLTTDSENWDAIRQQVRDLQAQMPAEDILERGLPARVLKGAANMLPFMMHTMSESWREATLSAVTAGGATLAMGAATPIPGDGLVAVTPVMVNVFTVHSAAKSAMEAARIEGGLLMADLATMSWEGPDGEEQFIDPAVVRTMGAIVGTINGMIEMSQLEGLKGAVGLDTIIGKATRQWMDNALVSGIFRNRVSRFITNYGTNLGEEVLQEMMQEMMTMAGEEFAKYLTNEAKQAGLPMATQRELNQRMRETFTQSLEGLALIGLPGAVSQTASDMHVAEAERVRKLMEKSVLSKLTENAPEGLVDSLTESLATAAVQDEQNSSQANEVARGEVLTPADRVRHLEENLNTMRTVRDGIREAMESTTDKTVLEELEHSLAYHNRIIEDAEIEVEGYKAKHDLSKESWEQTPAEFTKATEALGPDVLRTDHPIRQQLVEAYPAMPKAHVDASMMVLNMRADAVGMSLKEYVEVSFGERMFATGAEADAMAGGRKAAVAFAEDGEALIAATKQSDFSSFVHELSHVMRRQLDTDQLAVAAQWAGVTDGQWAVQHEERFAEAFEEYLRTGRAPSPEVQSIFAKIAEWMRQLINAVTTEWQLSEDIVSVFDSMLTGREMEAEIPRTGPDIDAEVAHSPIAGAVLYQLDTIDEWVANVRKWMKKHGYTEEQINAQEGAMRGMQKIFDWVSDDQMMILPDSSGMAKKKHGPIRENSEPIYKRSFDASSMCVKRLSIAATQRYIQKKLGRNITADERVALISLFREAGEVSPCLYCYVEAPRAKMSEMVAKGQDVLFEGLEIPDSWAKSTVQLARAAKAEIEELGLSPDIVDPNYFTDPEIAATPEVQAKAQAAPRVYAFLTKMSLNAKANMPKQYEAYEGNALHVPPSILKKVNESAGFRVFSTSDFQAEHVVDLIQLMYDLELMNSKSHAYTKTTEYVEIFGNTGQKINLSVFANLDEQTGEIIMNDYEGMNWDDAKRLRAKYPDVGTILVATHEDLIWWGLDQDWIDYIIPYHQSGLEKKFYSEMGWKDFSSTQHEKPRDPSIKGKEALEAWREENEIWMKDLDVYDGISNEEASRRYVALAKERDVIPVFEKFSSHPNYIKLKKDYARTDTPFRPVKANINWDKAHEVLEQYFEGMAPKAEVKTELGDTLLKMVENAPEGVEIGVEALRKLNAGQKVYDPDALFQTALPVQDPGFKAWFGDSQVVDAAGEPLLVFHGTHAPEIKQFEPGRAGGIYFADTLADTESYGPVKIAAYLRINKLADLTDPNSEAYQLAVKTFNERGGWSENLDAMEDRESPDFDPERDLTWEIFDNPDTDIQDVFFAQGYDGFKLKEYTGVSYVVFSPDQVRQVQYDGSMADLLYQTIAPATSQENLDLWAGETKVRKPDGSLKVVAHSTSWKFEAFELARANIENDLGAGFYFSDNLTESEANYSGIGPDLKHRINDRAEQLEQEILADPESFDLTVEEVYGLDDIQLTALAINKARDELYGGNDQVLEAYLRIERPLVRGGEKETVFTVDQNENEDAPLSGTLVQFVNALIEEASLYDQVEIDELVDEIYWAADYDEIGADELIRTCRGNHALMSIVDMNTGQMAAMEIVRKVFQQMGFDGVIDHTVGTRFRGMNGMTSGTTHYIIFSPNQVKSVENHGEWSRENNNIYHQTAAEANPKHERIVREAVAQYKPVPDHILEIYREKDWAQREIKRRAELEVQYELLGDMMAEAREYDTVDEYLAYIKSSNLFEEILPGGRKGSAVSWYRNLYKRAQDQASGREDANKQWKSGLRSKIAVQGYVNMLRDNTGKIDKDVLPAFMVGITRRGGELTDRMYKSVQQVLYANPTKYRRLEAQILGDEAILRRMAAEDALVASDKKQAAAEKELADLEVTTERFRIAGAIPNKAKRAEMLDGHINITDIDQTVKVLEANLIDAKEQLEALEDEYAQAQDEHKAELKRELKLQREAIREREAEKRAAKKAKEYMKKLAAKITREVPSTIDFEYRQMIEAIQAGIDPHFRSPRTLAIWENRRKFFESNPDMMDAIPARTKQRLYKKPLNDFTVAELEDLAQYVDQLLTVGRTKKRLRRASWEREVQDQINTVIDTILAGEALDSDSEVYEIKNSKLGEFALSTIRPERIADILDGRKDYKGYIHDLFINQRRAVEQAEARKVQQRREWLEEKMTALGLKEQDLAAYRDVDGMSFQVDSMIDWYAKWKNPKGRAAMQYGGVDLGGGKVMRMSHARMDAITDALTVEEKKFAEYVITEYDRNYDRLREAHIRHQETLTRKRVSDLGNEPFYTPLFRMDAILEAPEEQILQEFEMRQGLARAQVEKGFTFNRKEIPKEFQTPIRSGLYAAWSSMIAAQEHYIQSAELVARLKRILNNQQVKTAVRQQYGGNYWKELDKLVKRFANPSIYKVSSTSNRIARELRKNISVAYLAFNAVTGMKQLPSLLFYLPHAGHHLFAAVGEFAAHPMRTIQWAHEVAPKLKDRAIMRSMEEFRLENNPTLKKAGRIRDKVAKVGMAHIRAMDTMAVTIGFKAVYDANVEKLGEAGAVQEAYNVTMRTQPAADATEVASLYAEDSLWTFFLQFSNQLNQIFNMAGLDAASSVKNRLYWKTFFNYAAIAASALVMWSLATRSLPGGDDDLGEDITEALALQIMNMIPIVGSQIAGGYQGFSGDVSVLTPATAAGEVAGIIRDILSGDNMSEVVTRYKMEHILEALAILGGVPYIGPKRLVTGTAKAAESGQPVRVMQEVLLGGEKSKKEQ